MLLNYLFLNYSFRFCLFIVVILGINSFQINNYYKIRNSIIREKIASMQIQQSFRNDDDTPFLPLKSVLLSGLLGFGLFGSGIFPQFADVVQSLSKSSDNQNRGSKTRLTISEINDKLKSIPIFYVIKKGTNTIFVDIDGHANIYLSYKDALSELQPLKNSDLKVSASTIDEVFLPLISKQKKSMSLPSITPSFNVQASFKLIPSSEEDAKPSDEWKSLHQQSDIPIFRFRNLVFKTEKGTEFPLYLSKTDAIDAYNRLDSNDISIAQINNYNFEEISLQDVVNVFQAGGIEARALKFYPSRASLDAYTRL